MELSLCMIVKDEEERLDQCLKSVQGAVDEIVIMDTGSTDQTRAVAGKYTDKVEAFAWGNDFSAARNASLARATKPYILWLDADDVLEQSEREKLIALKKRLDGTVDAVMMPYHYAHHPDGTPSLIFERERIVRREAGFLFSGVVHEAMTVCGNVIHEDIAVTHTGRHAQRSTRRNLAIYEEWLKKGMELVPRDRYYYARELMANGQLEQAQRAFAAYLEGDGWAENRVDACLQRGRCLSQLGRRQEARAMYMQALSIGAPRAEALCALGDALQEEGELGAAAFWYRAAMQAEKPERCGGFVEEDAYGYIPAIRLSQCYDRMGRTREAAAMNERALLLRPGDAAALQNREYFAKKQEQSMQKEA